LAAMSSTLENELDRYFYIIMPMI